MSSRGAREEHASEEGPALGLDELLGRLCDGGLDAEQTARLRELLRAPAAQQRYVEYLALHEALRARLSPGGARVPLALPDARSARFGPGTTGGMARARRRGARWGSVGLVALAAAVALLVVVRGDSRRGGAPAPSGGIAVVTATAEARWAADGMAVQAGVPLSPGRLALAAGLAQLDLYSGATLVLEGPAALELHDARSLRVLHGRARVRASPRARGLRISLPEGQVVDLGTEFAVAVPGQGQGASEVHVVDGAIVWRGGEQELRLEGGQGLVLDAAGARAVPAAVQGFADPARLSAAASAAHARAEERRDALRARLRADPATLLYLDFDPRASGPWGRLAVNLATGPLRAEDGAIVGCGTSLGRWPDKPALEFKRPSDRVLVDVPGQHASFTLAAWVRFDGLDHDYNAFLHTDGWEEGDVHAHVQPSGELVLDLFGRERLRSRRRIGRADFGRWIHLAWTWDAEARRVSLYVDGVLDAHLPIAGAAPVRFGPAQIGNWDRQHRNLNGQLDELLLSARALSAAEIAELAEPGR